MKFAVLFACRCIFT